MSYLCEVIELIPHPAVITIRDNIIALNSEFRNEFGEELNLSSISTKLEKNWKIKKFRIKKENAELLVFLRSKELQQVVRRMKNVKLQKLNKLLDSTLNIMQQLATLKPEEVIDVVCEELVKNRIVECVLKPSKSDWMRCEECHRDCGLQTLTFEYLDNEVAIAGYFEEEEVKVIKNLFRSVFREKKLEEERKELVKRLTTNIKHFESLADRLRNPLAVIKGYLELRKEFDHEYVFEKIERQIEKMESFLDQVSEAEIATRKILRN